MGVDARAETLETLAARGEAFDVATLWHVLEHFLDPFGALKQIRTMLRPGGLIVIEVPNLHSAKFVLARHKWEGGNHPLYHRTFFTSRTLTRALREAGFSDVRRQRWSYAVPGRSGMFERAKRALDVVGWDAFLDATGRA
jgi:2-polyprenyl-3-methyl-5-hydroxy-6-metoxy-1,4-benzoquinol methylase